MREAVRKGGSGVFTKHSRTQQQRLLRVLGNAAPNWVPLSRILRLQISKYTARIRELRLKGYGIESMRDCTSPAQSWYRLVRTPDQPLTLVEPKPRPKRIQHSDDAYRLFD